MITRSITRGITRSIFRSATRAVQRFFTELTASNSESYDFETPIVPSANFEIEGLFLIPSGSATIVSGSISATDTIIIDVSGGKLRAFAYVGGSLQSPVSSTSTVNDGVLNKFKVNYTGTTLSVIFNGTTEATGTWALNGSQNIKHIGNRAGASSYFNGYIADIKIKDGTSLVADAPLNEDFSKTPTANNSANPENNLTARNITTSVLYELNAAGTVYTAANGDTLDLA